MKITTIASLVFLVLVGFLLPSSVSAAQCSYGSTQARVQHNVSVPWQPSIVVGCEKSFRVGGFHNGTGQFANDVSLQVTGPNYFGAFFQNGDTVQVSSPGDYTVTVRTNNQDGGGCTEQAHVSVVCQNITPVPPQQCAYGSTQARVQNNLQSPWAPNIAVGCERIFNVGSFHNGTGQFSNDTTLYVSGPGIGGYYANGQTVQIPSYVTQGNYSLNVTTTNQSGHACSEQANVSFTCQPQPTATPTPFPNGQCSYQSTESRVRLDSSQPWVKSLNLTCNQSFEIGTFHNNSQQFASDTTMLISDPYGFGKTGANGQHIHAFFPGQYLIASATPGQNGPQCADISTVNVSCNAPAIPDFWKTILQQFMIF